MKMHDAALAALLLLGINGCSGGDESQEPAPGPAATAPVDRPAAGEGEQAPCPVDGGSHALSASPLVSCAGRFTGVTYRKDAPGNRGTIGSDWLHRTATGCLIGENILLREDGSAQLVATGAVGTWTGDELYFRTAIEDRVNEYTRTEAVPSR
jgi:hypothetical protein